MRSGILNLLRNAAGFVSGENISQTLSISRTAVWKHIQTLKQEGYQIEAHPRLGYRLLYSPDLLLPEEISCYLTTKNIGKELYYMKQVKSTNMEAKALARNNCSHGTVVVAEEQSAGRGRLTRGWFSPFSKGIWFSVVLRPPFSPQHAPKCTLMAAVAVRRAIAEQTGIECGIKWPNDILWNGQKIVGILTEINAEMDLIHYIVIGIGINVNITQQEFPPLLRDTAISLATIQNKPVDRSKLLGSILANFEYYYEQVCHEGFGEIIDEWRRVSCTLGKAVSVIGIDRSFDGVAIDIDQDGALLVQTSEGLEKVLAGDVSIRAK